VILIAFVFTLCIFASSPVIKNILEIDTNEVVFLIGLTTLFNFLSLPYLALSQSVKKYKTVSFIGSSHHFIRLIFFVLLYYFYSNTYVSGLYANLFSFILIAIIAYYAAKKNVNINFKFNLENLNILQILHKNKNLIINLKSSSISTFFLTIMTSIDIILFRKLYPNDLSGFYSAISTLAKIPLFLSAITFTYFLTETSDNFYKKKNTSLILYYNLITNLIIFLIFISIFKIYGSEILMLIFKKEYNIFGNDLYYLTLAFAFVGFIKILILFLLSKNDNGYAPFLFLGIFFTLILCIFSDDYKAFINIMIYGYFVNCLLMIIYTFKKLKKIN
jgi:O-antigen/teichoic acid export membrane protein